VLGEM